jgi:hypothetical protein
MAEPFGLEDGSWDMEDRDFRFARFLAGAFFLTPSPNCELRAPPLAAAFLAFFFGIGGS